MTFLSDTVWGLGWRHRSRSRALPVQVGARTSRDCQGARLLCCQSRWPWERVLMPGKHTCYPSGYRENPERSHDDRCSRTLLKSEGGGSSHTGNSTIVSQLLSAYCAR